MNGIALRIYINGFANNANHMNVAFCCPHRGQGLELNPKPENQHEEAGKEGNL
jgi:hypothetical protein